jgi:hypothetical protein
VARTAFADDIQSPDDGDRDKFLLQRLPTLEFSMLPAKRSWLSALVPSFDFEYTLFQWRDGPRGEEPTAAVVGDHLFLDTGVDALPDASERGPRGAALGSGPDLNRDNFGLPGGTEGNGRFNEGEPLGDRGSRLVLRPRIGAPFRIADAVEVFPEVAWYQTLYDTRYQDFEERGLFTARLDLRTRLSRSLGKGMTHFFEPRIGYAFVSDVGQKSNPLLIPQTALPQRRIRQFDLDNVVLDPSDRIDEFNGITFGFGNRIFGRAPLGDTARLLADVDFSWQFDIDEGDSDLMFLEGRVYPTAISTFRFITGFDPDHGRLEEGLADLTLELYGGHALTLGYRYLRRAPKVFEAFPYEKDRFKRYNSDLERVSQGNLGARIAITDRLVLRYSIAYSFERNLMLSNGGGFEYVSGCRCWEIGITVRDGRSRGTEVSVQYRLTGLGQPRHSSRRSLDELMFVPGLLDAL